MRVPPTALYKRGAVECDLKITLHRFLPFYIVMKSISPFAVCVRKMLLVLWLSLLGLTVGSPAPLDLFNSSQGTQSSEAIYQGIPNTTNVSTTALVADIYDDFTLQVRVGSQKLSARSCLMVTLHAMVELSFLNYSDPFEYGEYTVEKYPDVSITAAKRPGTGRPLMTAAVIFGLTQEIAAMIKQNEFRDTILEIIDRTGADVATIHFSAKSVPSTTRRDVIYATISSAVDTRQVASITNRSESTNGIAVLFAQPSDALVVFAESLTTPLKISQMFLTLYNALWALAVFPSEAPMQPINIQSKVTGGSLQFDIIEPPPSGAPPFNNGWAARTLQCLPEYILEQGKLNGVKFIAGWEKDLLAKGSLSQERIQGGSTAVSKRRFGKS